MLGRLKEAEDRYQLELEERDAQIAELEEMVRSLKLAGRRSQLELHESMIAAVTLEVRKQLSAQAAADGSIAGETAGAAAGGVAGKRWAGAGAFIGTVIATLISAGVHRGCAPDDKSPAPAAQQPAAKGPGYGGRF